jgi:hypothetical protein
MRFFVVLALGLALFGPLAAQEPEDINAFPDFPGREESFGFCAACHAFRLVAQQGLTREQWLASFTWMTERHAMPELEVADRDVILDYLAKAFPPRAPAIGGRAGWRNPFLP